MSQAYTKNQVIQLCRNLLAMEEEYNRQVQNMGSLNADVLPYIQRLGSWGLLYARPFGELYDRILGLTEIQPEEAFGEFEDLKERAYGQEKFRAYCEKFDCDDNYFDWFLLMLLTCKGHVLAKDMYNQTMDELLVEAAKGNDESLFKAILVDPAVLAALVVQTRIAQAVLMGDEIFFQSLAKALTQKKPRRPAKKYDPIRHLIGCLDALHVLDGLTQDDLCDIIINHLDLYPHESDDPYSGLKKLIKGIREPSRK